MVLGKKQILDTLAKMDAMMEPARVSFFFSRFSVRFCFFTFGFLNSLMGLGAAWKEAEGPVMIYSNFPYKRRAGLVKIDLINLDL